MRAAVRNSGFEFPMRRITVSLAPADLRKEGPSYDLPIAISLLSSSGQLDADLADVAMVGELSLEGQVRHTEGILPMVGLARERGMRVVAVPEADADEASLVEGIEVLAVATLRQLVDHLRGDTPIAPHPWRPPVVKTGSRQHPVDLADVRGHAAAGHAARLRAALPLAPPHHLQRWAGGGRPHPQAWRDLPQQRRRAFP